MSTMRTCFQRGFLFAVFVSIVSDVNAQEYYMGASVGFSKTDTGVTNVTGTANLDEEGTGFKIFGGVKVNNNVAIELHYADFGEASLTGNNGDTFEIDGTPLVFTSDNVKLKSESRNIALSALIGLDSTAKINPYLRLGIQRWKSEFTVSTLLAGSDSESETGTDPFYGLGLDVKVSETLNLKFDFERNDIDDDDADLISVGLSYSFKN